MLTKLGYKIEWNQKVEEISIEQPAQILLHDPNAESIMRPSKVISIEEILKASLIAANHENKILPQNELVEINKEAIAL